MPILATLATIGKGIVSIVKADNENKKAQNVKLDAINTAQKYALVDKTFSAGEYDKLYEALKVETDSDLAKYITNKLKSVDYALSNTGVTINSSSSWSPISLPTSVAEIVEKAKALSSAIKTKDTTKIAEAVASATGKEVTSTQKAQIAKTVASSSVTEEFNLQATIQKYWFVPVLAIGAFLIMPVIKNK
jgi:hypothetical protein